MRSLSVKLSRTKLLLKIEKNDKKNLKVAALIFTYLSDYYRYRQITLGQYNVNIMSIVHTQYDTIILNR